MIRLQLAGPHTLVLSDLCARCPAGPAGCCATPPGLEWSDLGRIVSLGGRGFLLDELASGRLRPGSRGLLLLRVAPAGEELKRCACLGPTGCTLPPERRAATCNYYVCEDALADGAADPATAAAARRAHEALVTALAGWDHALAARVLARWPSGPPWDAAFLDWLGAELAAVMRELPPPRAARQPR